MVNRPFSLQMGWLLVWDPQAWRMEPPCALPVDPTQSGQGNRINVHTCSSTELVGRLGMREHDMYDQ